MLFGMAAASSAIDLIKSLTQGKSASQPTGTAMFSAPAQTPVSLGSGGSSAASPGNLISPDTMNALFAAQGQSTGATPSGSRSGALTNLFNTLDADGSGGISKSEFENALGAGGTNTANADSVFGKLDTDGDGSVSRTELAAALKPKHKAHGPKQAGGQDALLQALDGATSTSTTNSDGSTTTLITYADGSTVTMNQPAASSQATSATRSYNAIEQMIQRQAQMLTQSTASSLSVNA